MHRYYLPFYDDRRYASLQSYSRLSASPNPLKIHMPIFSLSDRFYSPFKFLDPAFNRAHIPSHSLLALLKLRFNFF